MDFKSGKKSVSGLFSCKKQFKIPRFQREYSWSKIELTEFLDDILKRIKLSENDELDTSEYFWGSLLLVGDLDDQRKREIYVVDGQQRITTMTIFLSVIAKLFTKEKENGLADALWEYIIAKDPNLQAFPILENETPRPFFQFTIQHIEEENTNPSTSEEENIFNANKFFKFSLSKIGLKKRLEKLGRLDLINCDYIEMLKIIRDQLLRSYVICISTEDSEYANMIFEILNAKGKELANIDLIKNQIFEVVRNEVPVDTAKELWKTTTNNLCLRNTRIELSTFFRHFWIMRYGRVTDAILYKQFQKKVNRSEIAYLEFLREMKEFSGLYSKVLSPNIHDYDNKKEYNFLIHELETLNRVYNIVIIRPVLLSLLYSHKVIKILEYKKFKKSIIAISRFHFIYNAICSKRTSSLEHHISKFANEIFNCKDKSKINDILLNYKKSLIDLLPSYDEFLDKFKNLKYSKEPISSNIISKQIIATLEMIYASKDTFELNSSIEHILDESKVVDYSTSIGNLVLLEQSINSIIPVLEFKDKIPFYSNSVYKSIDVLLNSYSHIDKFDESIIASRTEVIAKVIYDDCRKKIESIC